MAKTVKPRENRIPIMMSDEELAAIDDWRFGNRVATRSDAVRRLVTAALELDRGATEMLEKINDAMAQWEDLREQMTRLIHDVPKDSTATPEQVEEFVRLQTEIYITTQDKTWELLDINAEIIFRSLSRTYEPQLQKSRIGEAFASMHSFVKRIIDGKRETK